ncbi:hypothetical protein VKT23_006398 [Stygiomarasmius scandens]|uniref:BTB domain-containing protein n=1 Tax=Marasmiellus scandens TaxID=2682957 RepID=A0ABR1JSC3_9AGAR
MSSRIPDQTPEKVSEIFNAESGGDTIFRSSDKVLFYVHQKNLEFMSEGFPPTSHISSSSEIISLPESSSTLELLFQYTYHRLPPDLDNLKFRELMTLAEAAEKYVIHYARKLCVLQMSKFISKHPLELLAFAAEHDHETLMYEVAPLLIAKPLSEIAYLLPSSLYIPWSLYHDQLMSEIPYDIASKHFKKGEKLECSQYSKHDEFWRTKIGEWREKIITDASPRCQLDKLLDSVDKRHLGECCEALLQWRAELRDEVKGLKGLRFFVEQHRAKRSAR